MAHTCANCGMLCHCRGDIDDVDFGETYDCDCDCEEENDEDDDHWNDDNDRCHLCFMAYGEHEDLCPNNDD